MSPRADALVVGGGPAGLGFAIAAAARGLAVTVLERGAGPFDKACGEGLLPAGVRALDALGVRAFLAEADASPLREIRWAEPSGEVARLRLPAPGGLGVRRTALVAALRARAREVGVTLVESAEVTWHRRLPGEIVAGGPGVGGFAARLLVAADGLASPTRRREGLDRPVSSRPRFGLRRHFAVPPWAEAVEVHFGEGAEAYVTPVGARRVGVAVLFERGPPGAGLHYEDLLGRFPALRAVLGAAPADSAVRGAGPLERAATARVADRLVLLGDAAGYVDAVTGDGLSLALGCAGDLAALLPAALAGGCTRSALSPYERAWRRRFWPYAVFTRGMLALSRRPALRRRVLALASSAPGPFERLVEAAVG